MDDSLDTLSPPPSLGGILAAERERLGLTRVEVAQRLHMSASQIQAIEDGDYKRLPKGPFLRGFVRNYAKVLGLDSGEATALLAEVAPRDTAPHIIVPSHNIRFGNEALANRPYVRASVFAVVILLMGFASLYWWFFVRPSPPAQAQPETGPAPQTLAAPVAVEAPKADTLPVPAEPPRLEAPAESAAAPAPATAQPARSEAAKSAPAAVESPKPAPAAVPASAPAPGDATLHFRFRGESWVEVRDARGTQLMSRTNARDTEAQVSGKPPLQLIVGNAAAVSVRFNDRDVPLEPHTRVSVARFTIE